MTHHMFCRGHVRLFPLLSAFTPEVSSGERDTPPSEILDSLGWDEEWSADEGRGVESGHVDWL